MNAHIEKLMKTKRETYIERQKDEEMEQVLQNEIKDIQVSPSIPYRFRPNMESPLLARIARESLKRRRNKILTGSRPDIGNFSSFDGSVGHETSAGLSSQAIIIVAIRLIRACSCPTQNRSTAINR